MNLVVFIVLFAAAGLAAPCNFTSKGASLPISNSDAKALISGRYIAIYKNNVTSEEWQNHQSRLTMSLSKRDTSTINNYRINSWRAFSIEADGNAMMKIANSPEVRCHSLWACLIIE